MKTVRICCHSCDGNGWVEENLYPSNATVRVLCPECNGRKCVYAEKFEGAEGAQKMSKGYCDDAEKCENAGTHCDVCTRSWYFQEAEDWFEEREGEADPR